MPAILFLNRSWSFASDDFVLSVGCDIFLRIICLLFMGIPFTSVDLPTCLPNTASKVFFAAVFSVGILILFMDVVLATLSSKGGIMEIQKRSRVSDVLLVLFILSFIELAIHIVNICLASTHLSTCSKTVTGFFLAGNVLGILHIIQYYIWLGVHFRKTGAVWGRVLYEERSNHQGFLPHDTNVNTKRQAYELLSQSVQRRLRRLTSFRRCRCSREDHHEAEEQHAISSAAALFSEVFYDVDLVASDIMAGLLLLRWQTNQWVGGGHRVPLRLIERDSVPCEVFGGVDQFAINGEMSVHREQPTTSVCGDVSDQKVSDANPDAVWLSMPRLQRMCQMGISIYGKLFYMFLYRGKPSAMCRLCRHLSCNSRSDRSVKMGCCLCANHNCDLASVMEMGAIKLDSFVTITFENTLYHSPYFVAIDDRTRCIVIAVRGTLSLDDTIVDLLYDGVRLEEIETLVERQTGIRPTFVGHRGMVGSARRLYQRLLVDGAIEDARSRRPGYALVVCGHSLGAGIASFLTLLLRPMYPEVKGYALSAPLGMMNDELAEYTKPFLVSIIYGFDAFARMNKATVMDFKWRLIDALSVCKVPKYRILSRGAELCLGRCICRCCSPCCYKSCATRTVGRDTFLLDAETQDRLINPNPELPRSDPLSSATSSSSRFYVPTEHGDSVVNVAQVYKWPSRLVHGERSLLRWIDPDSARLFCSTELGSGDYTTCRAYGTVDKSDSVMAADTNEPKSYELRDATFGGRVLHIVDVDLSDCSLCRYDPRRSPSSGSGSEHPMWSETGEPFLSADTVNDHGCCYSSDEPQATVGVWTTNEQFKTFLIHPRMFIDHSPNYFIRAVNRLHATVTQDPVFACPYIKPSDVFRRMHHVHPNA